MDSDRINAMEEEMGLSDESEAQIEEEMAYLEEQIDEAMMSQDEGEEARTTSSKILDRALISYNCKVCDFEDDVEDMVIEHLKNHSEDEKRAATQKKAEKSTARRPWIPGHGPAHSKSIKAKTTQTGTPNMPPGSRATTRKEETRRKWLEKYNVSEDYPFKIVSDAKIRCKACEYEFSSEKVSVLKKHSESDAHCTKMNSKSERKKLAEEGSSEPTNYNDNGLAKDLCRAFAAANIPWAKVDHPEVKKVLQKWMGTAIPSADTVAARLDEIYEEVKEKIKDDLRGKPFWLGTDETQDACERSVANVMIGTLEEEHYNPPYLVGCEFLEQSPNNEIITDTIESCLKDLGITDKELFRALLSDSVSYMLKSGKNLKEKYPKLMHFCCLVHALHNVCEYTRALNKKLHEFIIAVKTIYNKSGKRKREWKKAYPHLPLPPRPVLSRWGTWIQAALDLFKNFDAVKDQICKMNDKDMAAIPTCKALLEDEEMMKELKWVAENLAFLPKTIKALEEEGLTVEQAFGLFEDAKEKVRKLPGPHGPILLEKFEDVSLRNPDIETLGEIARSRKMGYELSQDLKDLKWCPTTSVDLERSFSSYDKVLTKERHNLKPDNIGKIMIVKCYFRRLNALEFERKKQMDLVKNEFRKFKKQSK